MTVSCLLFGLILTSPSVNVQLGLRAHDFTWSNAQEHKKSFLRWHHFATIYDQPLFLSLFLYLIIYLLPSCLNKEIPGRGIQTKTALLRRSLIVFCDMYFFQFLFLLDVV